MRQVNIFPFCFLIIMSSCSNTPQDVEQVLKKAGSNRSELEQIINHYSADPKDSLKLLASYFLIRNMEGHYSFSGENADKLTEVYRMLAKVPTDRRNDAFNRYTDSMNIIYRFDAQDDIQHIKATYFIQNIDDAFKAWQSNPWGKDYDFKMFCEYILPYRIDHEKLTSWRRLILDRYQGIFNKISYEGGTSYEAENNNLKSSQVVGIPLASNKKAVKFYTANTDAIEFNKVYAGFSSDKILFIAYANGGKDARQQLIVNGRKITELEYQYTGSWLRFKRIKVPVLLNKGYNTIQLKSTENDVCIDFIEVTSSEEYDNLNIISDGVYTITNKYNNWYLSTEERLSEGTSYIVGTSQGNQPNQAFKLTYNDYGCYKIRPLYIADYSKLIDVRNASRMGGDAIQLSDDHDAFSQKWAIIPLEQGYYKIVNKNSGKCLEIPYDALAGSTAVIQNEFNGNNRQKWRFNFIQKNTDSNKTIDPDRWRQGYRPVPLKDYSIFNIEKGSGIEASCRTYDITAEFQWYFLKGSMPSVNATDLINLKTGNCREETQFQTDIARAFGIASAIDFAPQWPFRSLGHEWTVIFDKHGKAVTNYIKFKPGQHNMNDDNRKAKIFRNTYSENPERISNSILEHEAVPDIFQYTHYIDVTREYCPTTNVKIELDQSIPAGNKLAYLYIFNNRDWVPIYWGEIDGNKATFKSMGRDVVYLPAFYVEGEYRPAARVFVLTKEGTVKPLHPDINKRQQLILQRKHPLMINSVFNTRLLGGGKFQGANRVDFSDAVTLHTYDSLTRGDYINLPVNNKGKFKYLRYMGPKNSFCNINELIFFDENGNEITGKVIGTKGSSEETTWTIDKVFDNDILTGFDAPTPSGAWVGLSLEKPVQVKTIRFMPRTDGNGIEPGDTYELVYWDNGWKSAGTQIAIDNYVIFNNVPSNALYLLHNRTKGVEERIFTYEDGKQVWW